MTDYHLNNLILYAFQYALGRRSYVVFDVSGVIISYADKLYPRTKKKICSEIEKAIKNNNIGMPMDMEQWLLVKEVLQSIKEEGNGLVETNL